MSISAEDSVRKLWKTRPNRKTLSAIFELAAPSDFVKLFQVLYDKAGGVPAKCNALLEKCLGIYPASPSFAYPQTPPELFPIAHMGVDGVHYGYVIHATELVTEDYPIGDLCPMDADGVILVGANTRQALEYFLSFQKQQHQQDFAFPGKARSSDLEALEMVARELGLQVSSRKVTNRYDKRGQGRRIKPKTPRGWQFAPSADGIGVLAPRPLFKERLHRKATFQTPTEELLEWAGQAQGDGFLASSLWILREAYWLQSTKPQAMQDISARMADVYKALGRTKLAEKATRRARRPA